MSQETLIYMCSLALDFNSSLFDGKDKDLFEAGKRLGYAEAVLDMIHHELAAVKEVKQ